jgi:putative DNA primase/helicase
MFDRGSLQPDLRTVAMALGGDIVGDQVLAPGPGHSARDRSLCVKLATSVADGILVHSFAGDDPLLAKAYIRQRLFGSDGPQTAIRGRPAAKASNQQDRRERALAIWAEAVDPRGTASAAYLARRGIADITESAGHALRHHPSCPFGEVRVSCLVGLVRNIVSDQPQAIHRTAITQDGRKSNAAGRDRMALGPLAGGCIKLTPYESVTYCLGVAEGVETALSLQLVAEFGRSPVWALISASGLASFPVLPGIEALWIAVDHDPAGRRAAEAVGSRWRARGREVFLVAPREAGSDLNDLLKGACSNA